MPPVAFDRMNQDHVSELATRLGRGPLTWLARNDLNGFATTLICRFPDDTEIAGPALGARHPRYHPDGRIRSLRLLALVVCDRLLADVVADAAVTGADQ